jgi:hypothetical protein
LDAGVSVGLALAPNDKDMVSGYQQTTTIESNETKMLEVKESTQKESHSAISGVSWRKSWFYPFLWALAVSVIMRVISDDGWILNDFLAGWVSCIAYWASREFYAS